MVFLLPHRKRLGMQKQERRNRMKRFRSNILAQVLCFMAAALFVLPMNVASVLAQEGLKATTKVEHKPIKYFVPEKRIKLEADVTDEEGINLVRCYFRAVEQADYVFVPMTPGSSLYQGVLPAPSKDTEMIEYLFLAVNGQNQVVKTQTFKAEKKDDDKTPAWQEVTSKGDIHVSTELAQAPTAPPGFADSIAIDVAESSARFGFVVGGLYTALQASESGGTSGTAAAADNAGAISAKTGGVSTLAYVGGAALLAGGVALVAGGGGGGSSDHGTSSTTTTPGGGGGDGTTTIPTTIPTTTTALTTSTTTIQGGGGLSDVTVDSRNVSVAFWDCGTGECANDGDVIDVWLNFTPIVLNHRLSPSEIVKQVTLNPGQNTLRITAKQDGSCSGNDACLRVSNVTSGDASQEWHLSATGYDGASSSDTMTIGAPSTTPSTTTTGTTTTGTTTTQSTTTTGTTTTPTTSISTTSIPTPTTSTTSVSACANNQRPQVGSVSLYGYPNTSTLCVGDRISFTASGYDADSNLDIQQIHVRIVNTYTGAQNTQDFTPQPSGAGNSFTISRTTNYSVGYAQVRYCLYVSLRDKCGNWSNETGVCTYSVDCSGHHDDGSNYDNYPY
jgi:hypothetical protein